MRRSRRALHFRLSWTPRLASWRAMAFGAAARGGGRSGVDFLAKRLERAFAEEWFSLGGRISDVSRFGSRARPCRLAPRSRDSQAQLHFSSPRRPDQARTVTPSRTRAACPERSSASDRQDVGAQRVKSAELLSKSLERGRPSPPRDRAAPARAYRRSDTVQIAVDGGAVGAREASACSRRNGARLTLAREELRLTHRGRKSARSARDRTRERR